MPKKIIIVGCPGHTTLSHHLVKAIDAGHEVVEVKSIEEVSKEDVERGIVIVNDGKDKFSPNELPPLPTEMLLKEFTRYPLEEPKTGRQKRTERRKKNRKKKR